MVGAFAPKPSLAVRSSVGHPPIRRLYPLNEPQLEETLHLAHLSASDHALICAGVRVLWRIAPKADYGAFNRLAPARVKTNLSAEQGDDLEARVN